MVFSPPDNCSMSANRFPGGMTLYLTPLRYGSCPSAHFKDTNPTAITHLGVLEREESNTTLRIGLVLGKILVGLINTTRHVVVCLVEKLESFLLQVLEFISRPSGFFSRLVRFLFCLVQTRLDILKPTLSAICIASDSVSSPLDSLGVGSHLFEIGLHPIHFAFEFSANFLGSILTSAPFI